MVHDWLWTLRWLRHNPLFAVAITVILALGIGANTAVFSVVDAVLIRPLPYKSTDRLVRIEETTTKRANIGITSAEYLAWHQRGDLWARSAAYIRDVVTVTGEGAPDQVFLARVSPDLFPMLGVPTQIGRTPVDSDENVVVLSDGFWQRHFQGDKGVVGLGVEISGQVYTIIGVMPQEFEFPVANTDMWSPLRLSGAETLWVSVVAQLKGGLTVSQAQQAMEIVARRTEAEHPKEKAGLQIALTPWREVPERQYELTLVLVLAAVGLVLLIACADVAGLLLSRAVQRRKEIAIRAALGAGLGRLARQLIIESLTVTALGSLAGIALARVLLHFLAGQLAALPIVLPHLQTVTLNHRVLTFNVTLCVLLASTLSLAPIWMAARTDPNMALRSGRGATGSRRSMRLFSILIGTETALTFLLLTGSGLMIRSLVRLQNTDHGIHADHVLTMRVPIGTRTSPRSTRYDTRPMQTAYYRELIDRVQRVPGVRAAAVVNNLPLSGSSTSTILNMPNGDSILNSTRTISPQYFAVMGIPLVSGRVFSEADQQSAPAVAIVNEYLARQLFPGLSAVGRVLPAQPGVPTTTVVGVVKNAAQLSYEQPAKGELYRPYQQFIFGVFLSTIVVRTSGDPLALATTLRREIWAVDSTQPIVRVQTMEDVIVASNWRPRFSAWIFSILGGLALLLTSTGVYSVVTYTTTLRATEVGIRVALGAIPREIATLLIGDALRPLAAGLVVGLVACFLLSRLFASLLYETSTADPLAYVAAGLLLVGIGVMASSRVAWKAAKSDLVEALRSE
ncbi:MAG TPA: ABC transporter permease [Bryobacteraceae bacterium]|jgi:putative ABC transport system permease protein